VIIKIFRKHLSNTLKSTSNSDTLGDLVGLEPSTPKRLQQSESTPEKLSNQTPEKPEDLGNLVGVEPAAKYDNTKNLQENARPSENTSSNIKLHITHRKSQRKPKKGEPALWLLDPVKYPHVIETFRSIMNKIIALKEAKKYTVFQITSPHEGAGVSTITFNLALALAFDLTDKRILLVDTNIFKPSLHTAFGYSINPGLMDYIFGIRQLSEIYRVSDYPNLMLIPSGTIDHLTVTPFDLDEFSFFLEDARKQYDFVLLDAAPVLKSNQMRAISSKTDGVIIVAEANRTRREVVVELKQRLKNDGVTIIGSFLNKRRFFIPKWFYPTI